MRSLLLTFVYLSDIMQHGKIHNSTKKIHMINIVNIIGIDDENRVIVKHNGGSMSRMELTITGNSTLLEQVSIPEFKVSTLILGGTRTEISLKFPEDAVWFNSISSADGNIKSLKMLEGILKNKPISIINPPDKVLQTTRDETAQIVSGIDGVKALGCFRLVPRSISEIKNFIDTNDISFPFLFRPTVDHGKNSLLKIDSLDEISKLECFAFDGEKSYYITEFIDFASVDGFYRKMRFLVIGEKVIPRHLMVSSSWQIHSDHSAVSEEEIAFLSHVEASVVKRCLAIKQSFGLDYIGIDCAMDREGNLVIFEANAHSMIGNGKNDVHHQKVLRDIEVALVELLQ